ncbi:hypothetical protein A2303_07730 [Candidatus Falkowbacteria bacterium RIFOXYB2_FULL_47_14]|uniref:Peptidase C45 hydrolase domain-containing protein n=1 Tax=Candidatus Falkowbacteria bacterium RIFOXYA2_FULL_47_19 TaxID=1797994 RepID=A0A1F5SMI3_9BACT|nr:MAG: hypothetical protein A2227_04875 [Candidatus Falkowbacteria bacterium RIFOXYA2_FULL_47_19]OGF43409.1 MAG: hypothetical protein A2303_07730 [Candidatus Falkowbacteria bacterium RIFOXYB2_FULL_47_14]
MKKRALILSLTLLALFSLFGCAPSLRSSLPLCQRTVAINSQAEEAAIMAKASLEVIEQNGEKLYVLHLRGTPYEMGYQHGKLMAQEIHNLYSRLFKVVNMMTKEDTRDEIYDLIDPYIPFEEKEEMRGLAHGAGISLKFVHWAHAIPEVAEYGGKKRFGEKNKELKQTSCSNLAAFGQATKGGDLYQLRVLDWIRPLGAQKCPLVIIHHPDKGNASATFSYAGFIGAITGMNDKGMAFGEMGYRDPPNEDLRGIPFIFLFRKLMRETDSLAEAEAMIRSSQRTCSYAYMISDHKSVNGPKALLFIADRDRVIAFRDNTLLVDETDGHRDKYLPIVDVVYGGRYGDIMYKALTREHGRINEHVLMEMTKEISMESNMQNVVFRPSTLEAWISNASMKSGDKGRACFQTWFRLDLKKMFK